MKVTKLLLLTILVAMLAPLAHATPPKPDFNNLPAYIHALNASTDPQAIAIRQEIAEGPVALAKAQAAAHAAGIPLTPIAPVVAADQNAAPLYDQWWQDLRQRHAGLPDYAEVLSASYAYTPDQLAQAQKFFTDNQAAITLLHQATDKPALVYSKPMFAHYAPLREAAREIVTESYLLAHDGQDAKALANQARGFGIARQIMTQPNVINYLVAVAIDDVSLQSVQGILEMAGPNAELDAQTQPVVQSALSSLSLQDALKGDVATSLSIFDRLYAASPQELSLVVSGTGLTPGTSSSWTPEQQQFVHNLLDAAEARYLMQTQALIAAAALPQQRLTAAFVSLPQLTHPSHTDDPVQKINKEFLPVYSGQNGIPVQMAAKQQVLLAAAAVLAAKAQTGAFPNTLPGHYTDPFSGKPLGYRREGDNGFVVYSVGPQGTFDGGKPGATVYLAHQVYFRYPGPTPSPVTTANVLK